MGVFTEDKLTEHRHDEYNNTKDCDCWNEQWMLTHTYHNYSYSIYAIPLHSVAV